MIQDSLQLLEPVPLHPCMPLLHFSAAPAGVPVPDAIAALAPVSAVWTTATPSHAPSTSSLTLRMCQGQVCHVALWLSNRSSDVGVGWMLLSAVVAADGGGGGGGAAAFRPRDKLFDTDPVPLGEEMEPAPPLPRPFVSIPRMLLGRSTDDAGVSLSVVRVEAVGVTAGAGGGSSEDAVAPNGSLCVVLRVEAPPSSTGHSSAPLQSQFDLEWQYASTVYSPYVMKLCHSVAVAVTDGPAVVDMEPFAMVRTSLAGS